VFETSEIIHDLLHDVVLSDDIAKRNVSQGPGQEDSCSLSSQIVMKALDSQHDPNFCEQLSFTTVW